jgi:hypothetical protein
MLLNAILMQAAKELRIWVNESNFYLCFSQHVIPSLGVQENVSKILPQQ